MAVAFDAVGPSSSGTTGTSVTTLNWTHTNVGSGCAVLVGVSVSADSSTTTCTVGGNSATSIGKIHANNGTSGYVQLFGIANVGSGAQAVAVSISATTEIVGGSVSYTGAGTTFGTAFGTGVTNAGNGTALSVTVSGTTTGNLVGGHGGNGSATLSASGGATSRWSNNTDTSFGCGCSVQEDKAAGGSVTLNWTDTSSDFWGAVGVEILAAAAAGGGIPAAQPGRTWLRRFHHRQMYPLSSPPAAAVAGTIQPQPTFPLPRRILARAVWRGGSGTVGVRGSVQPQPTFPLPRRRLSRGFWGGLAGTVGVRGSVQPRPTVTQPRRNPYARAVWHGGQGGIAPGGTTQPWPTIPVPRRRPARAVIEFTPVTTTNQVPPAVPSGTVQPQPTTTPPRLHPSRAYVRFTPVTTINAGIPGQTQPWPTIEIPRRRPGRAVIEFTPVTTTNQVVAGISGTVQPRATLTWPRRKPVRAYTAVTYHPVRTTNAPPAAFVPALSPTGAGGSIEGELWRMARDGDWPKRPPGFGPVGEVPASSTRPAQASGRGWVGKKIRRFFWPREED